MFSQIFVYIRKDVSQKNNIFQCIIVYQSRNTLQSTLFLFWFAREDSIVLREGGVSHFSISEIIIFEFMAQNIEISTF